jgi:hypothetical protein
MRPFFFLIWSFLTCCCSLGSEITVEDGIDSSIVSFDYINHEGHNFNNVERATAEIIA